jgi:selenocysteine lyase/cysteine desulfurase
MMKVLRRAKPVLLPPLGELLASGGDARLELEAASGLNCYGCRPAPRPEALSFSSSTASSISDHAWRRASDVRARLQAGEGLGNVIEEQRALLARRIGVHALGGEIVFAPSGTDAALLALAIARATTKGALVSVLASADETGSGMARAVTGRHFASATAQGTMVERGATIAGCDGVELAVVPIRDRAGRLRAQVESDRDIEAAVARAVSAGKRVLLYAMDHSKLGNRSPSIVTLDSIETAFGDSVLVVVDACQMRVGRAALRHHVARGRMVLITGSKFFTGPPLSGALIVPPGLAQRIEDGAAPPQGVCDYTAQDDWPPAWRGVRGLLPARGNPGETLRWTAALAEMEAWYGAGMMRRRELLDAFSASVSRARSGFDEIALLPAPSLVDDEFPAQSIFPFFVRHEGEALSPAQCATIHRALNRDLSELLPGLTEPERELAASLCHIGQPVAVGDRAVLRVAAGARHIATEPGAIEDGLVRVFGKIRLLLKNLERVEAAF